MIQQKEKLEVSLEECMGRVKDLEATQQVVDDKAGSGKVVPGVNSKKVSNFLVKLRM